MFDAHARPQRSSLMFGFRKNPKDPLADPKSAERWLASFPNNDPLVAHGELLTELGRIADTNARRSPARLDAVFHLDHACAALRKNLTVQYIEHATRSSKIEHQLWSALFDLTQAFLVAYYAFAREVSHHAQSPKWQQQLPELLCRQIVHMGLDAKIRLYRYEQWIPAKWAELHQLFTLACSRQIERAPLSRSGGSGGNTTIEHEYLSVLLLQLMNAGVTRPRATSAGRGRARRAVRAAAPIARAFDGDLRSTWTRARDGLRRRTPAPPRDACCSSTSARFTRCSSRTS